MTNQNGHYKQLTLSQRYQIEVLRRKGFSLREIASDIGKSISTISRELSRNSTPDGYYAEQAESLKIQRQQSAFKAKKWTEFHEDILVNFLYLKWSPENISLRMSRELPDKQVSHTTIYRWIARNKQEGGIWYKDLIRYGKARWKGGKRKAGRSFIPDRVDISERPQAVETRERCGDWEGDTVYGKDAHLVTLVDRKSRFTLMGKVMNKRADTVADKMISLLKRVETAQHTIKTITLDNGGEFADHGRVSESLKTAIYFAKPYASCQRGTNENTNGIIRRWWPKKTRFGPLTDEEVSDMEGLLNITPRKVLGGLTPLEVYTGVRVALIT